MASTAASNGAPVAPSTTSSATATDADANAAEELPPTDPFWGRMGHLNKSQQAALDEFKRLAAEEGLFTPAGAGEEKQGEDTQEDGAESAAETKVPPGRREASHDDATLVRFLRARKFVPADALDQFRQAEQWRRENRVAELYENFDVDAFKDTQPYYIQWIGMRDKMGLPVYVYSIKHLTNKTVHAYNARCASVPPAPTHVDHAATPPKMLRIIGLYEHTFRFVLPLCSALGDRPHAHTPVSNGTSIVDVGGVGLKQFWDLKGFMQEPAGMAQLCYPESMGRMFIVNVPFFFQKVWGWIKVWFDPVTVAKISILGREETKTVLREFVDDKALPKQYGGTLDWEFGMPPACDEGVKTALGGRWWEGPVVWEAGEKGRRVKVVGTVEGKERREEVELD